MLIQILNLMILKVNQNDWQAIIKLNRFNACLILDESSYKYYYCKGTCEL